MKHTFLFTLTLFLLVSCQPAENVNKEPYPATTLPTDTTQLWLAEGNPDSDTVLILCQGGPSDSLGFEQKGKVIWRYLPGYKNYEVIHLHQAQTYNPAMFNYQDTFTVAMAKKEVANTSAILARAIDYFKNRNKKVSVVGHSYGAYCILHYLANHEEQADQYIISGGRVDDNPSMINNLLKGINGQYAKDAITYKPDNFEEVKKEYSPAELKDYRVRQLLKGTIGQPRYSKALAQKDLSNLSFAYAKNDQNVGTLTGKEIEFLLSQNAFVFETSDGHYDLPKRVIDGVSDGRLQLCCGHTPLQQLALHYRQHLDTKSIQQVVELIELGTDTSFVRSILGNPIDMGFDYRYLVDSVSANGCAVGAVFHIDDEGKIDQKWVGEICE